MNSFAEKVVLVTGATRGIGRATTIAFAREGANVVFCGRHEEWGEETARLARKAGGEATFVRADVRIETVPLRDVGELVDLGANANREP